MLCHDDSATEKSCYPPMKKLEHLRQRLRRFPWEEWLARAETGMVRLTITAILLLFIGMAAEAPAEDISLQAGLAVQSQQEYWRAEAFFQRAAILSPADFRPMLALAQLHRLERRYDLAQSELEMAQALDNSHAEIWLAMGDLAQDQGQMQQAERAWLQATRLDPATAAMQAHERLGLFYERQRRFHDAETHFAMLPASNALAQYHLGALRLERGDHTSARQAFEAAFSQTADTSLRTAARAFLQVLDHWDGSAASNKLLGFTYLQNNLPWLAAAPLQQAVALAPNDTIAHAYLGWSYLRLGLTAQAWVEEQHALKLEPENSFVHYVLSLLNTASGRYYQAVDDLMRALRTDPQNPLLWAARGELADQLGDRIVAEQALQRAVDYSRSDPQFTLMLASFYVRHQIGIQDGRALRAAQAAVSANPNSGRAYDLLGQIQQATNHLPGALQSFGKATTLAPTNASIHLHLATVQAALGYLRAAELNLRKAIVLDFNGPTGRQAQQVLQHLPLLQP